MPRIKALTPKSDDPQLTNRQRTLLFSVIKEFCETGESVGSKEIKEKYEFDFSSATIRNEFSALRDMGFLYQPFTNSSNKPTEKAFKLFVNQLIAGLQVTNKSHQELKKRIYELENQQVNLNKEISRLLAFQAGGVGFSVDEKSESYSGVSNLITNQSEGKVADILDFLENLDKYKQPLLTGSLSDQNNQLVAISGQDDKTNQKERKKLQAIFGSENPILPLGEGFAMVATEVNLKGKKSVVGLIAPNRLLAKKKNIELLSSISKILGEG